MRKMVLVKYHGIKLGIDADGKPRLLQTYDAGAPLVLNIGDVSDPIPYEEAMRLKADFGDAFEVVQEAEIPETPDEADALDAVTETDTAAGDTHVTLTEMKAQEREIERAAPTDIVIFRKRKRGKARKDGKEPFDKTVRPAKPAKLSRRKLTAIKKKNLWKLYRQWRAVTDEISEGANLDKKAKKPDIIDAILEMQR